MSAVEFGLASQTSLVRALPQLPFERPFTGSEVAVKYQALNQLGRSIASMTPEDLSRNLVALLRPLFPCDLGNIVIFNQGTDGTPWRSLGAAQLALLDGAIDETTVWSVYEEEKPLWISDWQQDERLAVRKEAQNAVGLCYRSLCRLPLCTPQGCLGVLSLASTRPHNYSEHEIQFLLLAADQVALGLANSLLREELQKLKSESPEEKAYVEDEQSTIPSFDEIVGHSPALQRVLRQLEVVAPTDSGVLIQGETGTGKELIAQAIHNRSARRHRPFIKVNCAAIPSGLLESELFGHEGGAFTDAIAQRIGRFELGDGGTLFLDEVGEIPLELQPKLLRVLQEHEFERLGGTRTINVDVRLIAATNRDLAGMVEGRCFRDDLYYRLNVFPIAIPPLRERPEDIDPLVDHFVGQFARRMNRRIDVIPSETREALRHHPWPGNVRELENVIQRAVILSPGGRLTLPPLRESPLRRAHNEEGETLEGVERAYVARVLEETNGVIGGPRGAAVRLGLKRTTLQSMLKRFGLPLPRDAAKSAFHGHANRPRPEGLHDETWAAG